MGPCRLPRQGRGHTGASPGQFPPHRRADILVLLLQLQPGPIRPQVGCAQATGGGEVEILGAVAVV